MPQLWPIKSKSNKSKKTVFVYGFLSLFILSTILASIFPHKTVSAQLSNYTPTEIGKIWNVAIALRNCSRDSGWDNYQLGADINKGAIFDSNISKTVGYGVDPDDDGEIGCDDDDDIKMMFDAIGIRPLNFLRDAGIYELDSDGHAYDYVGGSNSEAAEKISAQIEEEFGFAVSGNMPTSAQYAMLRATFDKECIGDVRDESAEKVTMINPDTGAEEKIGYTLKNTSAAFGVGYGIPGTGGDQKMNCPEIRTAMNTTATAYRDRIRELVEETGGGDNAPGAGGGDAEESPCEANGDEMGWILCPVIRLMDGALNWIDTNIQALLEVDSNYYRNDDFKQAFATIRNLAFLILVPISLVMILGTALGFDFVSAYTVKRSLPRLIFATLFIAVSYDICVFLVGFFNELGSATLGIITAPFSGLSEGGSTLGEFYEGGLITGTLSFIAIPGFIIMMWLFGATLLLAAGVAFLILMLRQMFIVVLIFAAPLAILAWIFPGNDKLWKLWWSSFSKLLFMYPLIMALLAVGRVFAFTIDAGNAAGIEGSLKGLMVMVAYMIPYALIPFTFRFAGGMFATVAGMANDRSKGIFDRQRKKRADKLERTKQGNMFRKAPSNSLRGRLNTAGAVGMNAGKLGVNPARWRSRAGEVMSNNSILGREAMMKDDEYTWSGNDDLNRDAALSTNESDLRRRLINSNRYSNDPAGRANMERDIAKVERMRGKYGNAAFRQAAFLSAMGGGTAFDNPQSGNINAWETAASIAGDDTSVLADLVAKGRSAAMGAGRVDQGGAGFGATMGIAQQFRTNPGYTGDDARRDLTRAVYDQQGGNVLVHSSMKANAVEQLAPAMIDNIEQGLRSGDQRTAAQNFASLAAVYDGMSASSPQKARIMADRVMQQEIDIESLDPQMKQLLEPALMEQQPNGTMAVRRTGTLTYQEAIEGLRGNQQFNEMRRELGAQAARQQQLQQQQQQGPGGPNLQPPLNLGNP